MNDTQRKVVKLLVTRELSEVKQQLLSGAANMRHRKDALRMAEDQEKSLRDRLAVLREIRSDLKNRISS
jgi:chaperonin cofactor prefoldin